jgi:hypothetical protein
MEDMESLDIFPGKASTSKPLYALHSINQTLKSTHDWLKDVSVRPAPSYSRSNRKAWTPT